MKNTLALFLGLSLGAAACGGDDSGFSPGEGTGALFVDGTAEHKDGVTDYTLRVKRGGTDVIDAVIDVSAGGTPVAFTLVGGDHYEGRHVGYASVFRIRVDHGEDYVTGSVEIPDVPALIEPSPLEPFDPHGATDAVIRVSWDGDHAQTVRVRTKDYEYPYGPDKGTLLVPAVNFVDEQQDIEISRRNEQHLAGGAPGSKLTAKSETDTTVHVLNPF